MKKTKIHEIFSRFHKADPNPTTELIFNSPFELLIAVILSAQATDKSVNKVTKTLYKIANTPQKIHQLGLNGLKDYIKSIGLYTTKAKNIMKTCELLIANFGGQVPQTHKELLTLPGVGRKTANVILNTLFKQPVIAVDTHIFRVANRIGLVEAKTPLAVEQQLMRVIPKEFLLNAHHWLILHGRYTCIARKPKCPECMINDLCEYKYKTSAISVHQS